MRGRRLIVLGALIAGTLAAQETQAPSKYAGAWVNSDPNSGGITRVEIEPAGEGQILIHAWGKCTPQDCDWGGTKALPTSRGFSWRLRDPAATRNSRVFLDGEELVIRMVSRYLDGRPARTSTDRFQRKAAASRFAAVQVRRRPDDRLVQVATAGTQPEGAEESPAATERTLLPDGTVVIRYPDGRVKTISKSGVTITRPDGTEQKTLYSQIPGAFPAAPSDSATSDWLTGHANSLLDMIQTVVNDDAAVNEFLQGEEQLDIWRRIERRSDALRFLMSP